MDFFIESQVKTFATFGDFPATGQVKTIYIDEATSNQYYWNGLSYVGLSDSNKVPYTGATGNVDLGENELKAGQITLDTSPTGTAAVGTTRWNNATGTSETTLKGGSVILKNGVDLVARVVNKVTPNTTLTKANYTAVRVSGAQGQRLAVAYAQANNDNNSADTIGLVIETIATNQEGFIMTVGQLDGINTTGSLQGETWVDGDVLYLSPTTPGALTNIKPTGLTGHIVVMGYVEYAHAVNGKIYVKIMNGWELDELHNVYIDSATLANNNILQYDSADQLWKNKVLSTGLTIGTTPIASGTVGRVLFEGTGNVVQESANLFWDNTNVRLGIGGTPTQRFHVQGGNGLLSWSQNGITSLTVQNNTVGTAAQANITVTANSNSAQFTKLSTGLTPYKTLGAGDLGIYNTTSDISLLTEGSGKIKFAAGGVSTAQMTLFSTGNFGINTTTDAGFKLDVNGTARVSGNVTLGNWSNNNTLYGSTNASWILAQHQSILLDRPGNERGSVNISTNAYLNSAGDWKYTKTSNSAAANYSLFEGTHLFRVAAAGTIDATINWINSIYINSTGAVAIGTTSTNASAQLQVDSTTKGFLPPRMTTTQKNAIASPATGLQVYDTTLNRPCFYDGTTWITL